MSHAVAASHTDTPAAPVTAAVAGSEPVQAVRAGAVALERLLPGEVCELRDEELVPLLQHDQVRGAVPCGASLEAPRADACAPARQLAAVAAALGTANAALLPTTLLRYTVRRHADFLRHDDFVMARHGLGTLTRAELLTACAQRGIPVRRPLGDDRDGGSGTDSSGGDGGDGSSGASTSDSSTSSSSSDSSSDSSANTSTSTPDAQAEADVVAATELLQTWVFLSAVRQLPVSLLALSGAFTRAAASSSPQ